jgi:hypothetical protein
MTVREDRFGNVVQASRPSLGQVVAAGVGSAVSAAFQANKNRPERNDTGGTQGPSVNNTRHVRLVATVPCWVAFTVTIGTAPVAVRLGSGSMFLPAGLPEYFWVRQGEQIAAIADAAAGSLYITELDN